MGIMATYLQLTGRVTFLIGLPFLSSVILYITSQPNLPNSIASNSFGSGALVVGSPNLGLSGFNPPDDGKDPPKTGGSGGSRYH